MRFGTMVLRREEGEMRAICAFGGRAGGMMGWMRVDGILRAVIREKKVANRALPPSSAPSHVVVM